MRLKLFRRRPAEEPIAVIATHAFPRRTTRLVLLEDGRVRWTCECDTALRSQRGSLPQWCKHIEKASAKRSVERLFGEVKAHRIQRH